VTETPPTLEYQRLERARKTAIGGLKLLGILATLVTFIPVAILLVHVLRGRALPGVSLGAFVVFGALLSLGIAKFLCALFIARRSRAAAFVALVVVGLECAGWLFFWFVAFGPIFDDGGFFQPLYVRMIPLLLVSLILTGWLAVLYEIIYVLRHEDHTL
jgi:hypothetical protein